MFAIAFVLRDMVNALLWCVQEWLVRTRLVFKSTVKVLGT